MSEHDDDDPLAAIFAKLDEMPPPALRPREKGSITPAAIELVLAALARGHAMREACRVAEVGTTTIYNLRRFDRGFARRFEIAKLAGAKALAVARLSDVG